MNRKGIGYIIEAFVSTMVVMIFVFSSFSSLSAPEKDWGDFRTRVTAQDATYTMQKTDYMSKMMDNGDLETLSAMGTDMTSSKLSMAGTVSGPPAGRYLIGLYTKKDQMMDVSLEQVSSGDRCSGDLEEINSEFNILRTSPSSVMEDQYDTRIYFADSDPQNFGGFNSEVDYDTFYVDRGTECQFSASEGPFSFDSYTTLNDSDARTFQIKNVSESGDSALAYEANFARRMKDIINKYPAAEFETNNFNFSDGFRSHDIVIFRDNSTLEEINSEEAAVKSYVENNPILFSMDLNRTAVNSEFVGDTGISYVNLTLTDSPTREAEFNNNTASVRIQSYMNDIGFDASGLILKPSKVSSVSDGQINDDQLVSSSNFNYDSTAWNYENSSMEDTSDPGVLSAPEGIPESTCDSPHRSGIFEFPVETDYTETTVYSTKLDGSTTDCRVYGVSIDKNNNGEIEENEKIYLDGETTEIKGRQYQVRIFDHDHVKLFYVGENDVEYFNFRQKFKDQDISKFGRIPEVENGGSNKEIAMLSSSALFLLEGDNTFGQTDDSQVSTSTTLPTERGVQQVNTRWYE